MKASRPASRSRGYLKRLVVTFGVSALTITASVPNAAAATSRENSVFNGINAQRTSRNLSTLVFNSATYTCAKNWSTQMANSDTLAHNPNLATCVGSATYVGETVAKGPPNWDVVTGWMNSCAHRAILLDPDFAYLGVGVANSSNGVEYATADFKNTGATAVPRMLNDCSFEDVNSLPYLNPDSVNSSSEQGRWYEYDPSSDIHISSTQAFGGSDNVPESVFVNDKSTTQIAAVTQLINANQGWTYKLCGHYIRGTGSGQQLWMQFLNINYGLISTGPVATVNTNSGWQTLCTNPATSPAGTKHVRIIIRSTVGATGAFYWDEITFERVS